ncbi:hypothetical protein VTJ04DRAFT_4303 [Mycothermus thermophilus]|uniref:uncharacterized protein n=1 Tax=Humicola insolens TaxID=85995 RepID=UPI003742CDC3
MEDMEARKWDEVGSLFDAFMSWKTRNPESGPPCFLAGRQLDLPQIDLSPLWAGLRPANRHLAADALHFPRGPGRQRHSSAIPGSAVLVEPPWLADLKAHESALPGRFSASSPRPNVRSSQRRGQTFDFCVSQYLPGGSLREHHKSRAESNLVIELVQHLRL